jgi:hypothetical protein
MSSKIQAEIEKALKTKQGKKEERDEYLERLVDDSLCEEEGLSDDDFKKLSKPTQKWLNQGATALDKNKPVNDFPDLEGDDEEEEEEKPKKGKKAAAKKGKKGKKEEVEPEPEDEDEGEEEEEEEAPKKSKKGKKGKKAAPVEEEEDEDEEEEERPKKKAAAKKEKPAKKDKKPSAISRMQFFCCKHPKWDKVRIGEKVRKEGYEFSDATLSIQYGATHKIMNIIAELAAD